MDRQKIIKYCLEAGTTYCLELQRPTIPFLFPILFCINMNKLISRLIVYGTGCQLGGVMGIFVYAGQIILLVPSRNGLQKYMFRFAYELALTH